MSIAVVFDSAGTLLSTYRVARDICNKRLLPGIETTTLTFSSPDRVLIVLPVHSKDLMDAPPDMLLSRYLIDRKIGFGVSCTRKIVTAEDIGDVLYADQRARAGDLQECIRNVWSVCKEEEMVTLNSGAIINMAHRAVEFTITAGGWPFPGAKETVTALHRMGVPTFIASGDRVTKLEKMADHFGIPLQATTMTFALALAATFGIWYAVEGTLSIHSIFTTRRELFYWAAILFTFALGTAAGDLLAEQLKLGYLHSAMVFGAGIAMTFAAYRLFNLSAVAAFWIAYILTRPFGASFGDLLSQPHANGGLGLGTVGTSALFLGVIASLIVWMTRQQARRTSTLQEIDS